MGLRGGEGGIRTLDTVTSIHTFQACSFDHSDTSPGAFISGCKVNQKHLHKQAAALI